MKVYLLVLLTPAFLLSQLPTISIHTGATVTVPGVPGGAIFGQTDCDANGNVYYRQLINDQLARAPLIKIAADGTKSLVLDFSALNGKDGMDSIQVRDFALVGSKVFMLALTKDGKSRVLEFSGEDARFLRAVTLESDFMPSKFGVLPNEFFFVFGIKTSTQREGDQVTYKHDPFKAIFNQQGQLIKDLQVKSDEYKFDVKGEKNQENFRYVNLSLIGESINGIYLVTPFAKPKLYVIGPDGEISHSFNLWIPEDNLRPTSVRAQGNQILVEYVRSANDDSTSVFVLYDASTGERLSQFVPSKEISGIFGCFDFRSGFTFISSDGPNHRVLARGDAR